MQSCRPAYNTEEGHMITAILTAALIADIIAIIVVWKAYKDAEDEE